MRPCDAGGLPAFRPPAIRARHFGAVEPLRPGGEHIGHVEPTLVAVDIEQHLTGSTAERCIFHNPDVRRNIAVDKAGWDTL